MAIVINGTGTIAGVSATGITTAKNRLRDITNQVDSMSTTDALKAATVTA
jgi:hypothetical protein